MPLSVISIPQSVIELCGTLSIDVSPLALAYGYVALNDTYTQSFTIYNNSDFNLTVTSITLPFVTYTVDWSSGVIGANSSQVVNVTFTPTTTATQNGNIVVNSNANVIISNTVAVTAQGVSMLGNGLFFDGVNDYVQMPADFLTFLDNKIQYNTTWSFSFWLYINANYAGATGQGVVLAVQNNTAFDGTTKAINIGSFGANNMQLFMINAGSAVNFIYTNKTLALSTGLHHFTITYNGSNQAKMYIDSVLQDTASTNLNTSITYSSGIATYGFGYYPISTFYQKGSLFDFKVFDKVLTQAEIDDIYANVFPTTANNNLIFNMNFESLYASSGNVYTPTELGSGDGQLINYPSGAKGIVQQDGTTDVQTVP